MKKIITIELADGEVRVDIDGVKSYTELLVALSTFEGVVGGILGVDKTEIRNSVDEIQKDLQAQLPD